MSLLALAGTNSVTGGYDIDNSLKVESANSEYFIRTFSSAGTQTTGTVSFWIKRTSLGTFQREVDCSNASGNSSGIFFESDQLCLDFGGAGRHSLRSEAKLRDTSAWYHCMAVWDTTQSTDTERTKLYINGSRVTSFSTATYPLQNATSQFFTPNDGAGTGNNCLFSRHNPANLGQHTPDGYHAEFHYIDGTAKTPSDFGEFDPASGIWKPKEYTGSHGSNGFYLDFADAADLGDDESGNGNDWTEVNITSADQATDTPTNNFATFNILNRYFSTTINEGATKVTTSDVSNWRSYVSTIAVSSGKWYAEFEAGGTSFIGVGDVSEITGTKSYTSYLGQIPASIGYYSVGLLFWSGASQTGSFGGFGDGDVISCALDKDNGFVYWARNGVWQNSGDPTSGATGTGGIALTSGNAGYEASDQYIIGYSPLVANSAGFANYGGFTAMTVSSGNADADGYGNFEYAPPSGYYALCTKNLEEFG